MKFQVIEMSIKMSKWLFDAHYAIVWKLSHVKKWSTKLKDVLKFNGLCFLHGKENLYSNSFCKSYFFGFICSVSKNLS